MEKQKVKEIESKSEQVLLDPRSPDNFEHSLDDAIDKLIREPNLYYLETDDTESLAMVKKRSDNSLVYETDIPLEVAVLKKVGIDIKDEL